MLDTFKDFTKQTWLSYRAPNPVTPQPREIIASLDAFERIAGEKAYTESERPIFLLSVSWRTGSTLLQRIVMTDKRVLIWGEPWGRMALIPRLTECLAAVSEEWPYDKNRISEVDDDFSQTFLVGDLYPPGQDFRYALKALVDRWLAQPARGRGYARWGLKEVRLDAADACILRWLYPQAVFFVLVRNPFDAFRSAKHWHLFYRWPDSPVECAAAFARHWNRLATSWRQLPGEFPYTLIKYEDILDEKVDFRRIEASAGITLDERAGLSARVGGTQSKHDLTYHERRAIAKEAAEGMEAFGYA